MSDSREHFQAFLTSFAFLFGKLVPTSADEQKCYFKAAGVKVSAVSIKPRLLPKIDLKLSPDLFFFLAESTDQWLSGNCISLCRRQRCFGCHGCEGWPASPGCCVT